MTPSAPAPTTASAMKEVLTDESFSDTDWIYERKLDGFRCVAIRDGGPVRLLSRNDLSLNGRFPTIAEALERQGCKRFAIYGEVVAFSGPQTSFAKLAEARAGRAKVFLYVFDVTWVDGEDVRPLPLRERKRRLREAIEFGDPIRFTTPRNGDGVADCTAACRKGWEGLIAQRPDSTYTTSRSRDWLKFK